MNCKRQREDINRPIQIFLSCSRNSVFWRVYQETGVPGEMAHLYGEGTVLVTDGDVDTGKSLATNRANAVREKVLEVIQAGGLPDTKKWGRSPTKTVIGETEFLL